MHYFFAIKGKSTAAFNLLKTVLLWLVVRLIPQSRTKIVFGAWWGKQFSDNPKYFLLYILRFHPDLKCYWVGDKCIKELVDNVKGVTFVQKGSLLAFWHCATAKYFCCNIALNYDITTMPTFGRAKIFNFWHGTAYKGATFRNVNLDGKNGCQRGWLRNAMANFMKYAYCNESYASFSYPEMINIMPYECPGVFTPGKSVSYGTPRIDYLIQHKDDFKERGRVRAKYAELLGLPVDKKWYLYLPTWRKGLKVKFSFLTSNMGGEYQSALDGMSAILIEKQHPQVLAEMDIGDTVNGSVYIVSDKASKEIDLQELLLASDRLITDYSSCFCDFETLDRPIIHFAYDYDWYSAVERGVEYELTRVAGGPIVKTESELLKVLQETDAELLAQKGAQAKLLISSEKGESAASFCKWVGLEK